MFTDLVGSTALSVSLDPDTADRLLDEVYSMLRREVIAHGGSVLKHLGDGLMAVFSSPSNSIACSEAMQRTVELHNRRASTELSLRVGVSMGEVAEEAGNYYGDVIVEAARLCATAEGGQVLLHEIVGMAARRRATQQLEPVGELDLKGLPDPVPTVELVWAAAGAEVSGRARFPLPDGCATRPKVGFVGRHGEQAQLGKMFGNCEVLNQLQMAVIAGEPGVGKTTLATECARDAHDRGAIVLFGHCDEEIGTPYQMWSEIVEHLIVHAPSVLDGLGRRTESLALLGPRVAALVGQPEPASIDADTARAMLFDAVQAVIVAASQLAPVVIVVDDLHWADNSAIQLLRHLVFEPRNLRLLMLGTYRESDVQKDGPLARWLADVNRVAHVTRLTLDGFDNDQLLEYMELAAGVSMGEEGKVLRDALASETGGNPFFVGALLEHLRETGGVYQVTEWRTSADLQERGMPISVREVVERRVAHLGDAVAQVLVTAAVVGQDFDFPVVASASELSEDAVLIALDAACEATLVSNVSPDRYSFVHAIIQHSLYNSVSATRTARLHRKVGEAIEALPGTERRVSELAYHFGRLGSDAGKGMKYARLAGDQAMAQFAAPEALEWFEQALELAEQTGADDDSRARILTGLGNARRYAGDPLYRQTLLDAGGLARRSGNTEILADAVLSNTRGIFSASGVSDSERIDLLESACEAVTDETPLTRARVLALLASETMFSEDLNRRQSWVDEAIDLARRSGSGLTVAAAINSVLLTIATPANLVERLRLCDEAVAAAQDCGDPWIVFWANNLLGFTRAQTGDLAWANDAYDHSRAIAEKLDQPILVWLTRYIDAGLVLISGDTAKAEELSSQAFELGAAIGEPDAFSIFAAQFATIRLVQGRSDEIVDLLAQETESNGIPAFRGLLASVYCDLDRPEDARAALEPLVKERFASVPENFLWLPTICLAADPIGQLEWTEPASWLAEWLLPYADQIPHTGPVLQGSIAYYAGNLLLAAGRPAEGLELLGQAEATHQRMGAAWYLARTRLSLGSWLARTGGNRDRALAATNQALASAKTHGYPVVERRAAAALSVLEQ